MEFARSGSRPALADVGQSTEAGDTRSCRKVGSCICVNGSRLHVLHRNSLDEAGVHRV